MGDTTSIFKTRLRELRGNAKQQEIADALGISRATLGYYENGDRKPDIEILAKIAEYFNVSCDYLLGFTDTKTQNMDFRHISSLTGLTERSLDTLTGYYRNSIRKPKDAFDAIPAMSKLYIKTLNYLLFPAYDILENITYYLYCNFEYFYDDNNFKDESLYKHISELGLFDKKTGISFAEDYDYFTQVFLIMIQKELSQLREICQTESLERVTPLAKAEYSCTEKDLKQFINDKPGISDLD